MDPVSLTASAVAIAATMLGGVLALDRARRKDAVGKHDNERKLDEIYRHFAQPDADEDRVNLPTQVKLISADLAHAAAAAAAASVTALTTQEELRAHVVHENREGEERTQLVVRLTGEVSQLRSAIKELSNGT